MTVSRNPFLLIALASLASAAQAVDVTNLGASVFTPGTQGWYIDNNTDPLAPATIDTAHTNDGDGSLHFSGTANEKKYVTFGAPQGYTGSGPAVGLGTLGQLAAGSVSADLFRTSTNADHPTLQVAVKIIFSDNRQLTWESAYNDNLNVNGSWVTEMMGGGGEWWLRGASTAGNHNFDQIANLHTLAGWAAGVTAPTDGSISYTGLGLDANSQILGFSVGYGSFVGAFDGNLDHLDYNFAGGQNYSYNFKVSSASAVPGPAAALPFVLGFARRVRRRKHA